MPRFADRDAAGVPVDWVTMIRASLRTLAPRFAATRMVREYRDELYAPSSVRATK